MSASCHHHSSAVFSARGEIGFCSTGNSMLNYCFVNIVKYPLALEGVGVHHKCTNNNNNKFICIAPYI